MESPISLPNTVFQRFSYTFPIDFTWFPTIFQWVSYDFPMIFPIKSPKSPLPTGLPQLFKWLSHDFPQMTPLPPRDSRTPMFRNDAKLFTSKKAASVAAKAPHQQTQVGASWWKMVEKHGGKAWENPKSPQISQEIKTGWWFEPLWNILVNWDDYTQYMGKLKMFQTTNQLLHTSPCTSILR